MVFIVWGWPGNVLTRGYLETLPLTKLSLAGCETLTDLSGIEKLVKLRELDLGDCVSLTDLAALSKLTELVTLELSNCRGLTRLKSLQSLKALHSLDVSRCTKLTNLQGLQALHRLRVVSVHGCSQLKSLQLPESVTILDVSGLPTSLVESLRDYSGLKSLRWQWADQGGAKHANRVFAEPGFNNVVELDIGASSNEPSPDVRGDRPSLAGLGRLEIVHCYGFEGTNDVASGFPYADSIDPQHVDVSYERRRKYRITDSRETVD